PAAAMAAAYGREHPGFSIGLHVDLGEWVYRKENWECLYEVVPLADRAGVAHETDRQLAAFRHLLGRNPSHIDSHQHVHRQEPVHAVLVELARQLDVPLRHYSTEVRYCGRFYGQTSHGSPLPDAISVEGLMEILGVLP